MASAAPKLPFPGKILVLRGGALGDFIVTLPTLAALKQRWPQSRVELIGNATAAELARHRGLIDYVHSQHDARWAALFNDENLSPDLTAWLAGFDLVVNYWPDADGVLARHFPVRAGQQFVAASAMPTRAPAAAHYADALRPLGVAVEQFFVRLDATRGPGAAPVSNPQRRDAETSLPGRDANREWPNSRWVAVHPGSGSRKKNWPHERWIELLATEQSPILLITGEAESAMWNGSALRRTPLGDRLHDGTLRLAANLPLETLSEELAGCRLFVGHDSGVSHLAAACGVPCVLLFGPTDPAMWAPPAPHVQVIHHGPDPAVIAIGEVRAAMAAMAARDLDRG